MTTSDPPGPPLGLAGCRSLTTHTWNGRRPMRCQGLTRGPQFKIAAFRGRSIGRDCRASESTEPAQTDGITSDEDNEHTGSRRAGSSGRHVCGRRANLDRQYRGASSAGGVRGPQAGNRLAPPRRRRVVRDGNEQAERARSGFCPGVDPAAELPERHRGSRHTGTDFLRPRPPAR